jgi:hypothetical protein
MKKYILLILSIILLTGCNKESIYLSDNFYNSSEFISTDSNTINEDTNSTYLLYIYNNYCSMKIPCENIFKSVMEEYNISMYSLSFKEFKDTYLYDTVKYAPSVIIVDKHSIVDYLDSESDEDYDRYQDNKEFTKWLKEYIKLKRNDG